MDKKDHKKSISLIPKLDFTKVQEKYNSETMKKISVLQNKIPKTNLKKEREEDPDSELKNLKKQNSVLQKKLEKYKNGYIELKEKYKNLKSSFKISNNKIEFLEMQIKRMTNRQSTEDMTNKRTEHVENVSMVINFKTFFLYFFIF